MVPTKNGLPEEEELVLCSVTGVNPHSVFVTMDEYGGKTGMIHISEVAPGRIRNIREHVQEGKKVVCKVLRINKERGHIDLSLRRVNDSQKRRKLNEIKQEQFSKKIIEYVAKQTKTNPEELFRTLTEKIVPEYGSLFAGFEEVVQDKLPLDKLIDKKIATVLIETIKARIKPPEVRISGELKLTSYAPDGVQQVKDTLAIAVKNHVSVRYLGAGRYNLEVIAEKYKDAEKVLKAAMDGIEKHTEKSEIIMEWERKKE